MKSRSMRLKLVVIGVLAAAIGPLGIAAPATAATEDDSVRPRILIIGDSITARYNDVPGSPRRGWWSYVGAVLDSDVITSAQSGTGFLSRGGAKECALTSKNSLTTFATRVKREVTKVKPDTLIIAGGANDWRRCSNGTVKTTSSKVVRKQIHSFMKVLERQRAAAGIPRSRVLITDPRGSSRLAARSMVERILAKETKQHGFVYVRLTPLPDRQTRDRTHPNAAGSRALGLEFLSRLSISRLERLSTPLAR